MRIFASKLMLFVFILGTSALGQNFGTVRIPGKATIKHEGDYVAYDLIFNSECFTNELDSITTVSENVLKFVSFLDERVKSYTDGIIDYSINLINTYQDTNPYVGYYYHNDRERTSNPCYEKYFTNQTISIRVEKYPDSEAINKGTVQGFYDELYSYLWPLNHRIETELTAKSGAKITSVSKGLFDGTFERIKEQAYEYATQIATRRFLAVLGAGYSGRWFLNKADFTSERFYRESDLSAGIAFPAPVPQNESAPALPEPVPTVIDLEPLSYSIEGVFEFGFTHDFNEFSPI